MLLEILQQINIFDVLFFLLFIRVISISIRKGFAIEFFKLLGTALATYIALHYFTTLSDQLQHTFGLRNAPLEFVDFVSFLLLVIIGYNFIVVLRIVIVKSRAQEALTKWSRWSAMVLGVARGILLTGLIAFGLVISTLSFFSEQVSDSMMGIALVDVPSTVYEWTWENVTQNVSGSEKINNTIAEVKRSMRGIDDDEEEEYIVEPLDAPSE